MHLETAKYFQHFYSLVIKPKLFDSLVDSQWNYFLSMFKGQTLQKDRIDLYFNIIENERKIKPEGKPLQSLPSTKSNLESTRVEQIRRQHTPLKQIHLHSQHNSVNNQNQPPHRAISYKQDSNQISLPKRFSQNHHNSYSRSPSPFSQSTKPKSQKQSNINLNKLGQTMKKLVITYEQTHLQLCRG